MDMIHGSSFHLRTIMEKDLDELVLLLGDFSKQGDFLEVRPVSQNDMRKTFEKNGFWADGFKRLLIIDESDRIIGMLWIFRAVPYFDALELGYKLFYREHWGKGLTTEAVGLVVDYLFSSEKVNRLEIRCDVDNKASARVAEKLGFSHEGIAKQATFARGKHHDMHQFALLRTDWMPSASRPGSGKSTSSSQENERRVAVSGG